MTSRRSLITAAAATAVADFAGPVAAQTAGPKESIAILGTGRVGHGIGRHWVAAGHDVVFGSRTPSAEKAAELAGIIGSKVRVASYADAVKSAAIILLAIPYRVVQETLASLGSLAGKILIDPTNPPRTLLNGYPVADDPTTSAAERIQSWTPGAKVVKALNTINYLVIANPKMGQGPVTICIAGDDAEAKARVGRLIANSGLEPVDVGLLIGARHIEGLARIFTAYRMANPDKTFEIHLRVRPNDLGPMPSAPPPR